MEPVENSPFKREELILSYDRELNKADMTGKKLYLVGSEFKALSWVGFVGAILTNRGRAWRLSESEIKTFYENISIARPELFPPSLSADHLRRFSKAASLGNWLPAVLRRGLSQVIKAQVAVSGRSLEDYKAEPKPMRERSVRQVQGRNIAHGIVRQFKALFSRADRSQAGPIVLPDHITAAWQKMFEDVRAQLLLLDPRDSHIQLKLWADDVAKLVPYAAERQWGPESEILNARDALELLRDGLRALDTIEATKDPRALANLQRELLRHVDELRGNPTKRADKTAAALVKSMRKVGKEKFKPAFDRIRGSTTPGVISREFTAAGRQFTETAENVGHGLARSFLEQMNPGGFAEQIAYLGDRGSGIRVSEDKKTVAAQGTTVNHRWHAVQDAETEREVRIQRHGAFNIRGLDILPERDKQTLLLAQALPVLASSFADLAMTPDRMAKALGSGNLTHVYQMLVSPSNKNERKMVEESRLAMQLASELVRVQFSSEIAEPEIIVRPDGRIFMKVPSPVGQPGEFGVQAMVFSQGLNEKQAIGEFVRGTDEFQERVNAESHRRLLRLFELPANRGNSAVEAYLKAWAEQRPGSELDLMTLRRRAISACGGGYSLGCMSAKDRGACLTHREQAIDLAAASSSGIDHLEPEEAQQATEIQASLFRGLSLQIAQQNVGPKRGYAFRPFQLGIIDGQSESSRFLTKLAPDVSLTAGGAPA